MYPTTVQRTTHHGSCLLVVLLACAGLGTGCSSPVAPPDATLRQTYLLTQFGGSTLPYVIRVDHLPAAVTCDVLLVSQRLEITGNAAAREITIRPHVCTTASYNRTEVDTLSGPLTVQGSEVQISLVDPRFAPSTVFARVAGDSLIAYREEYDSKPPVVSTRQRIFIGI